MAFSNYLLYLPNSETESYQIFFFSMSFTAPGLVPDIYLLSLSMLLCLLSSHMPQITCYVGPSWAASAPSGQSSSPAPPGYFPSFSFFSLYLTVPTWNPQTGNGSPAFLCPLPPHSLSNVDTTLVQEILYRNGHVGLWPDLRARKSVSGNTEHQTNPQHPPASSCVFTLMKI